MGSRGLIVFSYKQSYYCFYNQYDSYKEYIGSLLVLMLSYYNNDFFKQRLEILQKEGLGSNKLNFLYENFSEELITNYSKVLESIDPIDYKKHNGITFKELFLEENNLFNCLVFKKTAEWLYNEKVEILYSSKELKKWLECCNFEYYYNIDLDESKFNFYKVIVNYNEKVQKDDNRIIFTIGQDGRIKKSISLQLKFKSDIKNISENWRLYEKCW